MNKLTAAGKYFPGEPVRSRGFSLVEMLVIIAILTVVIAAVYSLFYRSQRTYTSQDQVVAMQQNARAAIELMSQELRMAGYDFNADRPSNAGIGLQVPGTDSDTSVNATTIRITADLNQDGNTREGTDSDENEEVTYQYAQDINGVWKLTRNTQTIADHIINFQITYFLLADGSYHGLGQGIDDDNDGQVDEAGELRASASPGTDPLPAGMTRQVYLNAVRLVRINLTAETAQIDPDIGRRRQYTLSSDVALKNLSFIK